MGMRIEGIKKESRDMAREFSDVKSRAKEVADARKRTLERFSAITSLDEDVLEALDASEHAVKNDAKRDFIDKAESPLSTIERRAEHIQSEVKESVSESEDNSQKLESIASETEYGTREIRSASSKAEQMGKEYSSIGEGLTHDNESAKQEVADRKREIES